MLLLLVDLIDITCLAKSGTGPLQVGIYNCDSFIERTLCLLRY